MGMVKNFMDVDYFQPGICELLWFIKLQGYEILYLTARPISTIHATRQLLADNFNLVEENFKKPPPGPVITCCYGRLHSTVHYVGAFFRVVLGPILQWCVSHEDFKTDLLSRIRSEVFLEEDNSLVAGIGDTDSDCKSYRSAGIPNTRIFRILKNGAIEDGNHDEIAPSDFPSIFPSLTPKVQIDPKVQVDWTLVSLLYSKFRSNEVKTFG